MTFTNLIPIMVTALQIVSRELVGFIPAVVRDPKAERAAIGQSVNWPVAGKMAAGPITPAEYGPTTTVATVSAGSMTLTKQRSVPFTWTGEEFKVGANGGFQQTLLTNQFAQAFRTLANEIEAALAALYYASSRAYGTAGTTPFGTAGELDDIAEIGRILDDNGAPVGDRHLILNTAAAAKLGGYQTVLFKVNEAGTQELLRQGVIGMLEGFMIGKSAQVAKHATIGTDNGAYVLDGAHAAGDTTLALKTGAGTILKGDVVQINGAGGHMYTAAADLAGGVLTINEPGLIEAEADGHTVKTQAAHSAMLAFDRNAYALATRLPAVPPGGDAAANRTTITDPVSGLSFEVAEYRQYRQVSYEVGIVYGVGVANTPLSATLLG